MIYYALWGTFESQKPNRRMMDSIKSGLNELINSGIISYEEVLSSFEYVLDLAKLEIDTSKATETKDFFVIVQDTEIHTIMNSKAQHKFKLCRYFVFLVGTFNSKTQIGFSPLGYMVDKIGISKPTIVEYNTLLEEMELIYIYRSTSCIRNSSSGEIKKITNTYGRYSDKAKVIQEGKAYTDTYGYGENESRHKLFSTSDKKSASMKYNFFVSGKKTYNDEELEWMYNVLSEFNASLKSRYGEDWEYYSKDLSVFKECNFYCEDIEDSDWGEVDSCSKNVG